MLVNFDPTVGAEVRKRRPAVVISNDLNNRYAPVITVVPVSTNISRVYPFEVALPKEAGLRQDSKAMANQVRTVSKDRVLQHFGALPKRYLIEIEDAILLHLAIERG